MSILSFIFFVFLSAVAVVGCVRAGKLAVRAINGLFDKIEDKISILLPDVELVKVANDLLARHLIFLIGVRSGAELREIISEVVGGEAGFQCAFVSAFAGVVLLGEGGVSLPVEYMHLRWHLGELLEGHQHDGEQERVGGKFLILQKPPHAINVQTRGGLLPH